MRIILPTAFTLLTTSSPLLYAAEEAFVGPSVAIGASLAGVGNKVSTSNDYKKFYVDNATPPSSGKNLYVNNVQGSEVSVQPIIDVSWNWRLAPTWVAGIGANLEIVKRSGPEFVTSHSSATGFGMQQAALEMPQHAALYGLVGKQLGENWLLYGKLGYHRAKAKSSFTTGEKGGDSQQSFNLTGASIGFGAAYKLPLQGMELRMEAENIMFKGYTHTLADNSSMKNRGSISGKPSMTRINLMLGYRF